MLVLWKSLVVAAGAVLFAGIVYIILAVPGLLTDSASTVPTVQAKVVRR